MNEYKIERITSSINPSSASPNIDGNNIVWRGNIGGELLLNDGSETIQLINSKAIESAPQISGDNIVWEGGNGDNREIFLYDGDKTIQLTDNDLYDGDVRISGDNIVWEGNDGDDKEIFLYDGSKTVQLTDNDRNVDDFDVAVSGDNVVWASSSGFTSEIFLYDDNKTIQLTDNDVADLYPKVSGDNVVWRRDDGNDTEIILYNGSETIQLTDNDSDDVPEISGDNVVWEEDDGNDTEIFLYNGSETIQLTDNDISDSNPKISDERVIWQQEGTKAGDSASIFLATPINPLSKLANEELLVADADDTIRGSSKDDVIFGDNGDNLIYGNDGDDILGGGIADEDLDSLAEIGGRDTLSGGADNDTYLVSQSDGGGSIIRDRIDPSDTDFLFIVAEDTEIDSLVEADADEYSELLTASTFGDAALEIARPEAGIMGIQKSGTNLIIDLNRDGIIETTDDLTILDFFDKDGELGKGSMEQINNIIDLEEIVDFF